MYSGRLLLAAPSTMFDAIEIAARRNWDVNRTSRRRENFGWPGIVLIETQDDAALFANEQDEDGVRYASRIHIWLELNAGDARQRETAKDLYQSIIKAS